MSILQIVKLTTKQDDEVLQAIAELKKIKSDVFHLFVNGTSISDIAFALDKNYNYTAQVLKDIRDKLKVSSNTEMLSLVIPAMIRKECQDEINLECTVLKKQMIGGAIG